MSKLICSIYGICILAIVIAVSGCESSDSGQKGSMYNPNTNPNMTSGGTGMGSGSMNSGARGDGMNGGGTDTSR